MKILMLKRLESSWKAFQITVNNIYTHHEGALAKVKIYQNTKRELNLDDDLDLEFAENEDEDLIMKLEGLKLGKKNPISIRTIDQAGRLEDFKNAVKKDKENLLIIQNNIREFQAEFELNHTSDIKLQELINTISKKQKGENKKVIIFTAYKDTAEYLYKELQNQNLKNLGLVYGDQARASFSDKKMNIQTLLQHFAPYTKLFLEKRWDKFVLEKTKKISGYGKIGLPKMKTKRPRTFEAYFGKLIQVKWLRLLF